MSATSFSVIIPSFNGVNRIGTLLHALNRQTYSDFETIVVIDGSTDKTLDFLQSKSWNLDLKIITQANKGRAGARNEGARRAKGNLLLFLDDDMQPEENWLKKHLEFHKKYPHSILAGNPIEPSKNSGFDFAKFRHFRRQKWNRQFGSKLILENKQNLFLTGANFSIPKKIFFELSGFDDDLNDAEDFDLAMRAMNNDTPIYFDPNNKAWHIDQAGCVATIKRMRQYRLAHDRLEKLKPELYNKYNRYKITYPKGLKRYFFKLLAKPHLPALIDQNKFNWLPKRIRYSFYEYVLASLGNYFPEVKLIEK